MKKVFFLLLMITSLNMFGQGQFPQLPNSGNSDQSIANTFNDIFKGEPGKAALYSLLIPGGGQAYNKKWWKVPIAVSIDAATLYYAIDSRNNKREYQSLYITSLESNGANATETKRYKLLRDQYRKRYDYARVYFVLGHLLTVFDAYIDNHMRTFDVSDDLSLGINENGVGLRYHF